MESANQTPQKKTRERACHRSYKDYAEYLVELDIKDTMAHIRHPSATSFFIPMKHRQKKLCSLGQ